MDDTVAGGQADFVEIFPTVAARGVTIAFDLEDVEAFKL